MALTLPNCELLNKCDCKSCNPDGTATDLVIIDYENDCYQCYSCGHKFNEQDSLDFEWDRMHADFKKNVTPQMCIIWKSFKLEKERKEYVGRYPWGNYVHLESTRKSKNCPDYTAGRNIALVLQTYSSSIYNLQTGISDYSVGDMIEMVI